MNNKKVVTAIILAAGSGSRMGISMTKQRLELRGESVLKHSVRAFAESNEIDHIIVVCREDEISWAKGELLNEFKKVESVVIGGKTRAESAINGFKAVTNSTDYIAIHDAARCLVTPQMIDKVVFAAYEYGAATASVAVTDTLKKIDETGIIKETVPRDCLYSAQTPQVFSYELYEKAITDINGSAFFTDDNMLVERIGGRIFAVETGRNNIKITTPEDIEFAECILERRGKMGELRIGHGYDVHRLVDGRKLVLGGVEIPHNLGLLGHSDADVLTHAVMDAILGACALGDIGKHFPDTDDKYKNISSMILLSHVSDLILSEGYSVENIDATLILQKPKIAPYIDEMIDNFANILKINKGRVNIKATTEERLGFTGREEGISAHAVVLIKKG